MSTRSNKTAKSFARDDEEFFRQGDEGTYEGGPALSLAPVELPIVEIAEHRPTAAQLERRARNQRRVAVLIAALCLGCIPIVVRQSDALGSFASDGVEVTQQPIEIRSPAHAAVAPIDPKPSAARAVAPPAKVPPEPVAEPAEPPATRKTGVVASKPATKRYERPLHRQRAPGRASSKLAIRTSETSEVRRALASRIVVNSAALASNGGAPPTARFAD